MLDVFHNKTVRVLRGEPARPRQKQPLPFKIGQPIPPRHLTPVAEVADNKVVLVKDSRPGRSSDPLSFAGHSICRVSEEAIRLVLFKVVTRSAGACAAVLHADLPVLTGIFNGNRAAFHDE